MICSEEICKKELDRVASPRWVLCRYGNALDTNPADAKSATRPERDAGLAEISLGRLVRVEKPAKGLGRGCETVGGDERGGSHPGPVVSEDRGCHRVALGRIGCGDAEMAAARHPGLAGGRRIQAVVSLFGDLPHLRVFCVSVANQKSACVHPWPNQ